LKERISNHLKNRRKNHEIAFIAASGSTSSSVRIQQDEASRQGWELDSISEKEIKE